MANFSREGGRTTWDVKGNAKIATMHWSPNTFRSNKKKRRDITTIGNTCYNARLVGYMKNLGGSPPPTQLLGKRTERLAYFQPPFSELQPRHYCNNCNQNQIITKLFLSVHPPNQSPK